MPDPQICRFTNIFSLYDQPKNNDMPRSGWLFQHCKYFFNSWNNLKIFNSSNWHPHSICNRWLSGLKCDNNVYKTWPCSRKFEILNFSIHECARSDFDLELLQPCWATFILNNKSVVCIWPNIKLNGET